MADLLGNDTDYEMDKYLEANLVTEAGINPAIEKNKKSVFNTETSTYDILMPLSRGGYIKIGEEGETVDPPKSILIEGMEFGPETPEFQRYYPAPQPEVMETASASLVAPTTESAPIEGAVSFANERMAATGAMPTMEDFDAAGYTPDVVEAAGLMGPQEDLTLSPDEIARKLASGEPFLVFGEGDPTIREAGTRFVEDLAVRLSIEGMRTELLEEQGVSLSVIQEAANIRASVEDETDPSVIQEAEQRARALIEQDAAQRNAQINFRTIDETIRAATGSLRSSASVYSNALFGTGETNPLEVGVADFATFGALDIQEGYRMFSQSNQGAPISPYYATTGLALDAASSIASAFGSGDGASGSFQRLMGMGLMAAGVAEATVAGKPIAALMKKGFKVLEPSLIKAGAEAEQRIAQEGSTMFSNPVGPGVDRLLAGVAKLVSKTKQQGIRSDGGLPIVQKKGDENLRLHLNRLQKMQEGQSPYPGAPKNPRTVIPAPEGSDLPDIVVGNIEPDDWRQRIEATMSPEEINKAASWYKIVFGEFQKQANGDPKEIAKLTDAWFAGQQNSSPQQTLNDVLFVYEQIKRGVSKDKLKGKGLPSANKIVIDILTDSTIEGGAGQKISDFLDSGYGKNVRAIMGNKPEGGSPFVVDIHTARDTGLVDEIYINHLTRLGYNVPENLIVDVGGGGIKGPQYESRALFGQQLTEELNDQNWMGRNDWEPAEIQAIGWMQLSGMYGGSNTGGDVVDAFTRTTRRISMEVDPGAGSPWASKFGEDFSSLPLEDRRVINDEVTSRAIDFVNKQTGITLGNTVHGTGGWELWQNPSTVQQAIASKETAIEAGARLGYLLQQTEVWINTPKAMTKNPKNFSIDIVETTGENLRDSNSLTTLFDRIIAEEPNGLFRGYQPIIVDGKPGIRILITDDAVKESPLTKSQAVSYIQEFANTRLGAITDELNFDAEIDIMEADLTRLRNNWEEDQTGGGYKSYFSGQLGENAASDNTGQGILDIDGAELENLFKKRIDEARAKSGAR